MAIPEACGLWIEQRVQEELENRGETGTSLRAIGRQVAAEVEKYFETKVSPDAIRMKASRVKGGTNVPPKSKPPEIQPYTPRPKLVDSGGKREGAGRPKKNPASDWDIVFGSLENILGDAKGTISELSKLKEWKSQKHKVLGRVKSLAYYVFEN